MTEKKTVNEDIKPNSEWSEGERPESTPLPWYVEQKTPESGCDIYGQGVNRYIATTSGHAVGNAQLIVHRVNSFDALVEALKEAKEIIKTWHGPEAWDIYDQHSPEMIRLNSAIEAAFNPKG